MARYRRWVWPLVALVGLVPVASADVSVTVSVTVAVSDDPVQVSIDPYVSLQNDAGQGGDAPNIRAAAWPLSLGAAYEGTLVSLPLGEFGQDPVLDPEDWYRFYVHGPSKVTIRLDVPVGQDPAAALGMSTVTTYLEIFDPAGALANWVAVRGEGRFAERDAYVEHSGWYHARVWPQFAAVNYGFSVSASAADRAFAAHDGNGFLALPIDVPEGGAAAVEFRALQQYWHDEYFRSYAFLLKRDHDGSYERLWDNQGGTGPLVGAPSLTAAGGTITPPPTEPPRAIQAYRSWTPDPPFDVLTEPGTYVAVVMGKALGSYFTVTAALADGASLGEPLHGGPDAIHALRRADFEGTAGASEGLLNGAGASLSYQLSAAIDAEHHLLGKFDCTFLGQCRITDPLGTTQVTNSLVTINRRLAGTWTFHRDLEVSIAADVPVLFVADIRLP